MRRFKDFSDLKQWCLDNDYYDSIILKEPDYSSAVVGITGNGKLIYSHEKMVEWLIENDGMTEIDAIEFINHNTLRAMDYMGEMKPIVLFGIEN